MPYIFLDESGQLNRNSMQGCFVLASFTTANIRATENLFRSWQHHKFPRKLRDQSEIKFSDIRIDRNLRLKTLEFIAQLNIKIRYSYLSNSHIPNKFFRKDKLESGQLYTYVVGETLKNAFAHKGS